MTRLFLIAAVAAFSRCLFSATAAASPPRRALDHLHEALNAPQLADCRKVEVPAYLWDAATNFVESAYRRREAMRKQREERVAKEAWEKRGRGVQRVREIRARVEEARKKAGGAK